MLTLDINKDKLCNKKLVMRVNDQPQRPLSVTILNNGELDKWVGYFITFYGTNGAGKKVIGGKTSRVGDKIDFTFPKNAFSASGDFKRAYFQLQYGDDILTTGDFEIEVISDINMTAEDAEDIISLNDEILDAIEDIGTEAIKQQTELKNTAQKTANNAEDIANSAKEETKKFQDKLDELAELNETGNLAIANEVIAARDGEVSLLNKMKGIDEKSNKNSYYITPEFFGAKGDGVSDDSNFIQKAIEFSGNNNCIVNLSKKTYMVKKNIIIKNNYFIINGNGATLLLDENTSIIIDGAFKHCLYNNMTIKSKGNYSDYDGVIINLKNNWYEYNQFKNVRIEGFKNALSFNMGDGKSTESGIVYNKFSDCSFSFCSMYGLYISQKIENNKSWANQNIFENCLFGYNRSGFNVEETSVQNLVFNSCSFEGNGYHQTTEFKETFAFKGNRVDTIFFNNCYIENNTPYKIATDEEKTRFNESSEKSPAGHPRIGELELYYDYHNYGIRPIKTTDLVVGDIIVDSHIGSSNVFISGCIISLSSHNVVMKKAGKLVMENNKIFQGERRNSACYQAVIVLEDKTTNMYELAINNVFSAGRIFSKDMVDVKGILGDKSIIEGNVYPSNLNRLVKINERFISGIEYIYVSNDGNDNNIGVFENKPLKTLNKAIEKINCSSGPVSIKVKGEIDYSAVSDITKKDVSIIGEDKKTSIINFKQQKSDMNGFSFIRIVNNSIIFKNITLNMVKPTGITNFIFSYAIRTEVSGFVHLINVNLKNNDKFSSIVHNPTGSATVKLENVTTLSEGAVFRGYPTNYYQTYEVSGDINWEYPKSSGKTNDRPSTRYLTEGSKFFNTETDSMQFWTGKKWV